MCGKGKAMKTRTLVRIRIGLYTFWAISSAWVTAMADVDWHAMGWEAQSCLLAGMGMSWAGIMMAYFDKSVWKLDEESKANGGAVPPELPKP